VCLIGLTGHGKSTTSNTLVKQQIYKISCSINSETDKVKGMAIKFRNDPKSDACIILDTPGLGDSKGRDTELIANMVVDLKVIGYVNLFIITINSQEPRFNEQLNSSIKLFAQMFGEDFFNNVLICFTKFDASKKA